MRVRNMAVLGFVQAAMAITVPFAAGAEEPPTKPKNVASSGDPSAPSPDQPAPGAATPETSVEKEATGIQFHWLVESGVATTYVFRGLPQYLEKTDPSLMTTLSLTLDKLGPGALTIGAWNAEAITDHSDQPGTKTEIDLTATYAFPIGSKLAGAGGYILYLYPEVDSPGHKDGAHELWASVSVNDLPVTPSLAVYAEFVRFKGVYIQAALSRTIPLGPITFTPWAGLAVSKYTEPDPGLDFGLNDVTVNLPFRWTHSSGFYASATLSYAYTGLLNDDASTDEDEASFKHSSTIFGLAVVGFSK